MRGEPGSERHGALAAISRGLSYAGRVGCDPGAGADVVCSAAANSGWPLTSAAVARDVAGQSWAPLVARAAANQPFQIGRDSCAATVRVIRTQTASSASRTCGAKRSASE